MYDTVGSKTVSIDELGWRTTMAYDADELESVTDALMPNTNFLYDASGHWAIVIDPANYRTSMEYDGLGRRTSVLAADGGFSSSVYDAGANEAVSIDPLGQTGHIADRPPGQAQGLQLRRRGPRDGRGIRAQIVLACGCGTRG